MTPILGFMWSPRLQDVQEIQATERAFAAILGTGSVVTWGESLWGGDSRA